jgi:5-methyltetrahydrofolate--homocysteine methyltransferase
MSIGFDAARWGQVKEVSREWWAGRLKRPLIHILLQGRDPQRPAPRHPYRYFTSQYPASVTAEEIADTWDYELSKMEYLGDAFPAIWPNFGPGIIAGFMGARVKPEEHTVWFEPVTLKMPADLNLAFNPDNSWFHRVRDICRAAQERWQGLVQVDMTDLGGNLDILSAFRPGESLLLDLYDHPKDVKRLTWQAHDAWWRYFDELNAVLRPPNPGYTAWTPIFSESPTYMLQCDFCYMIGPDMFDEFVKPELAASCRRLGNAFYHLDGPGQLCHLDSLLTIPELKGIQWVPGAGQPDESHWPEVYRKIRAAGKRIHVVGGIAHLDAVARQLGSAEGIVVFDSFPLSRKAEAETILRRYGAM